MAAFGASDGPIARFGSGAGSGIGPQVVGVGGHVSLNRTGEELLLRALPPVIHLRAADERAATFRWLLDRLLREASTAAPGADLAADDLAHLLFLEAFRACLDASESLPVGWLRAIADDRIAPALQLMHDQPGRVWQLEELAQAAAMSRTTFAERFRSVAGVPPLTYLLNWRMRRAASAARRRSAAVGPRALARLHVRQRVQQCLQTRQRCRAAPVPRGGAGSAGDTRNGSRCYGLGIP